MIHGGRQRGLWALQNAQRAMCAGWEGNGGCKVSAYPTALHGVHLDKLRAVGELGQLVLGMVAGYSPDEVAVKREWTPEQKDLLVQALETTDWDEFFEREKVQHA